MNDDVVLQGGVNAVLRRGDVIHRPAGAHTPTVHRLLSHLRARGFSGAPAPLGFDAEGRELVTFVAGEVHDALTPALRTPELVASTGSLLRRLHDASADFEHTADDVWMLPAQVPGEVICHGDIAPYNSVVRDGLVVGFIDFDTAHPGPRLWDIAYAVYRFAPLHAPGNPDSAGDLAEQARMAAVFCDAYGVAGSAVLIDTVIARLRALIAYMRQQADAGNAAFGRHIADGHVALYEEDIRYLRSQRDAMARIWASRKRTTPAC